MNSEPQILSEDLATKRRIYHMAELISSPFSSQSSLRSLQPGVSPSYSSRLGVFRDLFSEFLDKLIPLP
jgi:hypothetical protein